MVTMTTILTFFSGIAFNNEDYTTAFDSVRYVCTQRPYSIPIWNLFNKIVTKYCTPENPATNAHRETLFSGMS